MNFDEAAGSVSNAQRMLTRSEAVAWRAWETADEPGHHSSPCMRWVVQDPTFLFLSGTGNSSEFVFAWHWRIRSGSRRRFAHRSWISCHGATSIHTYGDASPAVFWTCHFDMDSHWSSLRRIVCDPAFLVLTGQGLVAANYFRAALRSGVAAEGIPRTVHGFLVKVAWSHIHTHLRRRVPCGFLDVSFRHGLALK
jgi:hypothetical protein